MISWSKKRKGIAEIRKRTGQDSKAIRVLNGTGVTNIFLSGLLESVSHFKCRKVTKDVKESLRN